MNTGECVCFDLVCVENLFHISKVNQGLRRTHHSLLNEFLYSIFLTEHRGPGFCASFSLLCLCGLPDPDAVVTIQCRGVGNNDLVAFLQPFEDLDLADGVAPEFHAASFRFRAVGTQDKHTDGLLCLSEGGSTDFQDVFESL